LGVVYYHLLAREYRDDFESLIEGRNYKWSSRINALEREGKISTVTKEILRGCLLPNSWEHRRINGTISPIARKYSILKFDDLIFKISSAVNELRKSIVVGRIDDNELGRNDLTESL
ncbi:hypothetical protein, partial [uncultured Bacteroides sp.]|uniref:hypothetical protein n=1 Tax=uncultured Bacteroides sp. TaxID=162156 RepID=UPI002598BC59